MLLSLVISSLHYSFLLTKKNEKLYIAVIKMFRHQHSLFAYQIWPDHRSHHLIATVYKMCILKHHILSYGRCKLWISQKYINNEQCVFGTVCRCLHVAGINTDTWEPSVSRSWYSASRHLHYSFHHHFREIVIRQRSAARQHQQVLAADVASPGNRHCSLSYQSATGHAHTCHGVYVNCE